MIYEIISLLLNIRHCLFWPRVPPRQRRNFVATRTYELCESHASSCRRCSRPTCGHGFRGANSAILTSELTVNRFGGESVGGEIRRLHRVKLVDGVADCDSWRRRSGDTAWWLVSGHKQRQLRLDRVVGRRRVVARLIVGYDLIHSTAFRLRLALLCRCLSCYSHKPTLLPRFLCYQNKRSKTKVTKPPNFPCITLIYSEYIIRGLRLLHTLHIHGFQSYLSYLSRVT